MKIKVTFTLDVDPEAWALEYGIQRKDVRADVQSYFEYNAKEQLIHIGCSVPKERKTISTNEILAKD